MIVPNQKIEVKNGHGTVVKTVLPEELSKNSNLYILVKCDKCGATHYHTMQNYNRMTKDKTRDYLCTKCKGERIKQTCKETYGVDNVIKVPEFYDKMKETNTQKYGSPIPIQNKDIHKKFINTMNERYGVNYSGENPELLEKSRTTMLQKSSIPKSKQEQELFDLLVGQYQAIQQDIPIGPYTMDIQIIYNNEKINVEADGYYWHCRTKEQKQKDIQRDCINQEKISHKL